MKTLVQNYTFNPSGKQIVFTDYTGISLESVLLVTNVTDNQIIYNFASPAAGGSVSGNALNLTYNTSGMSTTDDLQIFIEDGSTPATNDTLEQIDLLLSQLLKRSESLAVVDVNQRQRVIVDSVATLNNSPVRIVDGNNQNVVEIGSASPLSRYSTIPDFWRAVEAARQDFAISIRSKLIF